MPTYQYRCTECGAQLEVVQKFSDPALTECPNCAGRLRKLFNAVGVVFKGSGFYRTDSRIGSGNDTSEGASKEAKDGGKTAERVGANASGLDRSGDHATKGNGTSRAAAGNGTSSGSGSHRRSEKVGAGSGSSSTGGSGSD
jgi:putative FmdB family regulatory protein